MDQIVNHAAKWRYMSGGQVTVPLVLRGPVSSGIGMAAQHSQTLEAWFVHTPGLVVMMPSTAVRREGPAEERHPRRQPGRLPREAPALQPARARPRGRVHGAHRRRRHQAPRAPTSPSSLPRRACTSRSRPAAQLAARRHRARGRRPAHAEAARHGRRSAASIRKTGRLVVVSEGARAGRLRQRGRGARDRRASCDALRAAPVRVTAKDTPIPYAAQLERAVLPAGRRRRGRRAPA